MPIPYCQRSPGSNSNGAVNAPFLEYAISGIPVTFSYCVRASLQTEYVKPEWWVGGVGLTLLALGAHVLLTPPLLGGDPPWGAARRAAPWTLSPGAAAAFKPGALVRPSRRVMSSTCRFYSIQRCAGHQLKHVI